MIYNILNGDGLAYSFAESNIAGEIIVCREAFIDGELAGGDLPTFWQSRATFLSIPNAEYQEKVVKEFDKIINATDGAEFNLWFEYDLFCQVNMWFVLSMIQSLSIKKTVNAVYTAHLAETDKQFWNGFGLANSEELNICKSNRITLNEADLNLGTALWSAYKGGNLEELTLLSKNQTLSFPYLYEVVKAHLDRFPNYDTKGRPERVIEDIIKNISTDFNEVCKVFWKQERIYGFGDTQIKVIYDKVIQNTHKLGPNFNTNYT